MNRYAAKGINVSCRTINGEAFILDQATRALHKLDKVGSFIWDQINGLRTIADISNMCSKEFEGDTEEIRKSVQEFIDTLCDKRIAEQSSEPFEKEMISDC